MTNIKKNAISRSESLAWTIIDFFFLLIIIVIRIEYELNENR